MPRRDADLLSQIEADALDDGVPVATALRKCVALGGKAGSTELRDWATRELRGYGDDALPDYRIVPAPLQIDGATPVGTVTGQPIAPSHLPDFVQETVKEEFKFGSGVGELEELARHAETSGEAAKLQLPMGGDLVRLMNSERGDPSQVILAVYWSISPVTIRGILDQVRTILVQLVAELRAAMSEEQSVPTSEAASQAIAVAVYGKRSQVTINAPQAHQGSTATVEAAPVPPKGSALWTWARRGGAFIAGLATVAAAVFAFLALH
jgi:AbiTii